MKTKIKNVILFMLIIGLTAPVLAASKTKSKYVTLDPAPLKAKPSSAAKKTGTAEYASAVIVIKEEKGWCYVQLASDKSVEGWIPASALTDKKIKELDSLQADEKELFAKILDPKDMDRLFDSPSSDRGHDR